MKENQNRKSKQWWASVKAFIYETELAYLVYPPGFLAFGIFLLWAFIVSSVFKGKVHQGYNFLVISCSSSIMCLVFLIQVLRKETYGTMFKKYRGMWVVILSSIAFLFTLTAAIMSLISAIKTFIDPGSYTPP